MIRAAAKPYVPHSTEHDEQVALFQWAFLETFTHPELAWLFAVPNGAKLPYKGSGKSRFSPEAKRLKDEGMKSGVPDIVLPIARGKYHGLWIELKVGDNTASDNQLLWLDYLNSAGYCAALAWGWEQARDTILAYLEGKL